MSKKEKNKIPKPKPSLSQKVNNLQEGMKKLGVEQARIVVEANRALGNTASRLELVEQGTARLIDAQAVAFRIIFQQLGITNEMRRAALRELNAAKEFAALLKYVADVNKFDSGLPVFQEIVDIPPEENAKEGLIQIVIAFISPADAEETDEGTDVPVMTLQRNKDRGQVIDGPPPEGTDVAATFLVGPSCFRPLLMGLDSAERLFMEGLLGIDKPEGFYQFLYSIGLKAYAQKKQEEAEFELQKEQAKKEEGKVEINPADFETSGHPEGAEIFGGDLGQSPELEVVEGGGLQEILDETVEAVDELAETVAEGVLLEEPAQNEGEPGPE